MTRPDIEREVGALADLPRAELVGHWRSLYRSAPPNGISRALLLRAVAYELQARHYGRPSPALRRQLIAAANGENVPVPKSIKPVITISAGTRLVREWNGSTHVVEVVEGGAIWNGARYRSLSAVARAITGARWSGPRFFGLTSGEIP